MHIKLVSIILLALLLGACSSAESVANTDVSIEKAVKIYYASKPTTTPYLSNYNAGNTTPPSNGAVKTPSSPLGSYKVLGVSPEPRNDSLYVVTVDVETPAGKNEVERVFVRKYMSDGKEYWRAEPYNYRLDEKAKAK